MLFCSDHTWGFCMPFSFSRVRLCSFHCRRRFVITTETHVPSDNQWARMDRNGKIRGGRAWAVERPGAVRRAGGQHEEKWKCTLHHRERAKEANGPLLIAKFVVPRRSQPVPSAAVLVSARLAIRPACVGRIENRNRNLQMAQS